MVGSVLLYKTGSAPEYGTGDYLHSQWQWYRSPWYGVRRAAKWAAGQSAASMMDGKSFPFLIHDDTEDAPYSGSAASAAAITINDDGDSYGWSIVDYGEFRPYYPPPDDFYDRTRFGAAYSGYDFSAGTALGDLSVRYDSTVGRFVTDGKPYFIVKSRGGVTIGGESDFGPASYLNGVPVDYQPLNLNSRGEALILTDESPSKYQVYQPGSGLRADVAEAAAWPFTMAARPAALNHRIISVTDAAGQTTDKISPQVVGYFGTEFGSSGAAILGRGPAEWSVSAGLP